MWDHSVLLSCILSGGSFKSRDICFFHVLLGVRFGLESFRLWLPLIGLNIGGLSCLGFVIRVLERV